MKAHEDHPIFRIQASALAMQRHGCRAGIANPGEHQKLRNTTTAKQRAGLAAAIREPGSRFTGMRLPWPLQVFGPLFAKKGQTVK